MWTINCCSTTKDGNGSGLVRVECLGTQTRNPKLKPEPAPNFNSGRNLSPKPKPADTRKPMDNPKPELRCVRPWTAASVLGRLRPASGLRPSAVRRAGRGGVRAASYWAGCGRPLALRRAACREGRGGRARRLCERRARCEPPAAGRDAAPRRGLRAPARWVRQAATA